MGKSRWVAYCGENVVARYDTMIKAILRPGKRAIFGYRSI